MLRRRTGCGIRNTRSAATRGPGVDGSRGHARAGVRRADRQAYADGPPCPLPQVTVTDATTTVDGCPGSAFEGRITLEGSLFEPMVTRIAATFDDVRFAADDPDLV